MYNTFFSNKQNSDKQIKNDYLCKKHPPWRAIQRLTIASNSVASVTWKYIDNDPSAVGLPRLNLLTYKLPLGIGSYVYAHEIS